MEKRVAGMMTSHKAKKGALVFALFAFNVLSIGSWAMGARVVTALIRGVEAFLLFGALAWGVGSLLAVRGRDHEGNQETGNKGRNLDQTA